MNVEYPMLFNVTNRQTSRATHCGVLEFIAEEGVIYMPYWVGWCCMLIAGACSADPQVSRAH
jgi:ubiquitin fusion degradation protein 1